MGKLEYTIKITETEFVSDLLEDFSDLLLMCVCQDKNESLKQAASTMVDKYNEKEAADGE